MADKFIDPVGGSDSNSGDSDAAPRLTPPASADNMRFRFKRGTRYIRSSQWSWGASADCGISDYGDPAAPRAEIQINAPASTNALNIQGAGTHTIEKVAFLDCTTNTNGGVIGSGLVAATSKGANLLLVDVVGRSCNWNFVRINVGGAQAPDTFRMLGCDLDQIGEDGIFGGAQVLFEVAYSSIQNPSVNTTTGDCIGFFNADPTKAWVHHNYLYHPRNYKQVVIFDPTTVGAGNGLVEDNVMIGYEGANNNNNAVFNTEVPTVFRRNYCRGSGILMAFNTDNCVGEANICEIRGFRPGSDPTAASVQFYSSGTRVDHNLFIADQVYDQSAAWYLVGTGSGRTGNAFRNNILMNVSKGVKRGSGTTLALANNCLYNVATPYVDSTDTPISSTADVLADPQFLDRVRPWLGLQSSSPCRGAGAYIQGARDRFARRYVDRNIGPWAVLG